MIHYKSASVTVCNQDKNSPFLQHSLSWAGHCKIWLIQKNETLDLQFIYIILHKKAKTKSTELRGDAVGTLEQNFSYP